MRKEGDADALAADRGHIVLINAAIQQGTAHLPRISRSFPGVDIPGLVQRLRVRAVIERLS